MSTLHIIHPIGGRKLAPHDVDNILTSLRGKVLGIKLHPAFVILMAVVYGDDVIKKVKEYGFLVMIDDKSHDIRFEVKSFVEMYEAAGADILTVHASGGSRMLSDAVKAAQKMQIFGVTLLTSLEEQDCVEVYTTDPEPTVIRLMKLVEGAGCHGSVCAPRDLAWIRNSGISISARERLCPGIRDPDVPVEGDDQNLNRALTPYEAGAAGVSLMVVGRFISQSSDPTGVAERIEADFQKGKESIGTSN